MENVISILTGIISLAALIAFFVMAVNIARIRNQLTLLSRYIIKEASEDESKAPSDEESVAGFTKLQDIEGEAFCLECRTLSPKKDLYYNKEKDIYLHKKCLESYQK